MHAKSGGSSGEPPDFLFIPAACRSRKDLPRSAGGGDRARNAGNRPRDAEDGATGTGAGCGAQKTGARARGAGDAGAGCGARVRNTEDAGVGRRTQNAEHVDADADAGTGTGTGARGAGRRTQNAERRTRDTGYWPRAAEHGKRGHGAQETGHRRRGTSPRAWTAARLHTPARPRNNLPGPFTAGRHPPRAAHYLSRVRIRITPLPPRTPYMLLPRCTSTDLTS